MHIQGNGLPTKEIELHLKPVDTHYVLCLKPFGDLDPRGPSDPVMFGDGWQNRAVIHFEDTRELDSLIDMLVKFRDENFGYFGEWRRVP